MRERVMMVFVLVSVSSLSALMLAGMNALSREVIAAPLEKKIMTAVLASLNVSPDGEDPERFFAERIEKVSLDEGEFFIYREEAAVRGVAVKVEGPGFWGPISIVVGIDPTDLTIRGMEVLDQQETPGLGARIGEETFRRQFAGKRIDEPIMVVIKGKRPGPNDVAAVTGATITSKSLERILNERLRGVADVIESLSERGEGGRSSEGGMS